MTIVYLLHAIYKILSLFCITNNEEFVIDDSPFTIHRTINDLRLILPRTHMTFFVDDISLPIRILQY